MVNRNSNGKLLLNLSIFAALLVAGVILTACDQSVSPTPLPLWPSDTPFAVRSATNVVFLVSPPPAVTSRQSVSPPVSTTNLGGLQPSATRQQTPLSEFTKSSVSPVGTRTTSPTVTPWWTPIPTRTPLATRTATPQPASLRFLRPGAYSRVLSPILLEASVTTGEDGLVLIELVGEDGRTLARQRLNYSEYPNRSIAITSRIEFSLPGVAETARLIIITNDRFGRKIALSSLELVLLSIGENDLYLPSEQIAPYLVRAPFPDQIIQGGILKINGLARPVNQNPMLFELLDEQSKVISSGSLTVPMPSGALSHNPFDLSLKYTVSVPVRGRLQVRQESASRIPGTVALWSVPVLLQP